MSGNITEEQFKKFCKDFVEKYEGMNFQELIIKSLGRNVNVSYYGIIANCLTINTEKYGMSLGVDNYHCYNLFGYVKNAKTIFINSFGSSDNYFNTIEDLYKFFKMNEKETIEITLEVNLEDILKTYKEDISKKLGLSSENIKINLKRG